MKERRGDNSEGGSGNSRKVRVGGEVEIVGEAALTATEVRVTIMLAQASERNSVTSGEVRDLYKGPEDWTGTLAKLSIINGLSVSPNNHHLTIDGDHVGIYIRRRRRDG